MFHLVSLSLQISLTVLPGPCLGLCLGVACFVVFVGLVVGFFLLGIFDLNHRLIPVVDRPCLALVRQCRKKKAVVFTDRSHVELPEALEFTYKVKRWQADARGCCPVLQSRINVDWLALDPQMFAPLFPRLKEGILRDVSIQKAVVAWDNAPSNRIMVSLLLPGPMEADQWLHDVRTSRNMWPLQKTSHVMANQLATEIFMRRERRRLQARHIWEKIEPNWPMIEERVWTKQATGLPYQVLYRAPLSP